MQQWSSKIRVRPSKAFLLMVVLVNDVSSLDRVNFADHEVARFVYEPYPHRRSRVRPIQVNQVFFDRLTVLSFVLHLGLGERGLSN
jgi:hypothetical protein